MALPPPQTKEFVMRLEALAAEGRSEIEENSQALQEITLLINQTSTEVDRLTQRELQLSNRLREMDANLEAYARTDIRDMFRAAHDVELRLMMMRSQLEQLQEREITIRSYQEKLRTIIELAETHLEIEKEREGTSDHRTRVLRRGGTAVLPTVPLGDIIQAQEDERLRLANRVLEGPAQGLANLILQAEVCERLMERDPQQAATELEELRRHATRALADSRRMLLELRPVVLDELGVVPTLRRYVTELARQRPIEVNIIGPETDGELPEPIRLALYRLLQEALAAAAADENIKQVEINLRYEEAQVVGSFEAHGEELNRNQSFSRMRADAAIQRRLDQLGADLQFELVADTTVRLTLVIPLA